MSGAITEALDRRTTYSPSLEIPPRREINETSPGGLPLEASAGDFFEKQLLTPLSAPP
jgi:hypothetical protein